MTDDICTNIRRVLEAVLEREEDGICIELFPAIEPAVVVLIIGVFLSTCCTFVIISMSSAVAGDRYWQAYNGLRHDAKPQQPGRIRAKIIKLVTNGKPQYQSVRRPSGNRRPSQRKSGLNKPIGKTQPKHNSIPNPVFNNSPTFAQGNRETEETHRAPAPIVKPQNSNRFSFLNTLRRQKNPALNNQVKPRADSDDSSFLEV